jgi:hypothetical protein
VAVDGALGRGTPRGRAAWVRPAVVAVLVLVGLVGLALAVRGGVRLYHRLQGPLPPPRQADVGLIAGWMTVPYVARAYGVPGQELFAALGIAPTENARRSLDEIADRSGRDRAEVVAAARAAVVRLRSEAPGRREPPTGPATPARGPPTETGP